MPRTANKSNAGTPRANPAVNQAQGGDPNHIILDALNADRAAPDHSDTAQEDPSGRQADNIERRSPEKPTRSRPTH